MGQWWGDGLIGQWSGGTMVWRGDGLIGQWSGGVMV